MPGVAEGSSENVSPHLVRLNGQRFDLLLQSGAFCFQKGIRALKPFQALVALGRRLLEQMQSVIEQPKQSRRQGSRRHFSQGWELAGSASGL